MDTLIYLRRSVVDDDNPGVVSHEQQLARCRDLARQHGAGSPTVLEDRGRSGGEGLEQRRSAYQQLRDAIATGGVRWVVSYDLSRLSRSTKETLDLVDHARRRLSQKRGGGALALELEAAADVAAPAPTLEILALNDALEELARLDARKCQVIELRYFGGCTEEETSRVLSLSPATVRRDMRAAEAWLSARLQSNT